MGLVKWKSLKLLELHQTNISRLTLLCGYVFEIGIIIQYYFHGKRRIVFTETKNLKGSKKKVVVQFVRAVLSLRQQRALRSCVTMNRLVMNMVHMWPVEPERKQNRNLVSEHTAPCKQLVL